MIRMKGIETLIGAVLVIVITVSAIIIALQLSNPAIDRTREELILQEGEANLIQINNYVEDVMLEGNGSSRLYNFPVTDGEYFVFPENETIYFVMESRAQIIGVGVSRIDDEINVTGFPNKIVLFINYSDVDIRTGGRFGRGSHSLLIKSFGWDPSTQKHIVNITV